ncbi:MAG: hypothetical protein FWG63_07400 [Defluviitaleaceae bacterium]|nr:hypothetical protein [Defluviitaleaceae bacterium]
MRDMEINKHHNQDKVFKEALDLFLNKSLDFFGIEQILTEILSTETTETTTKKSFADNAFKTATNEGVHFESEADISEADLIRFCSSNIDLTRKHKLPFTTIILTPKRPKHTYYNKGSIKFMPKIIVLSELNADAVLENFHNGKPINELEMIYLPLYSSKTKTKAELLDAAIKIASVSKYKDKIFALQTLLMSTFMDRETLLEILEDNMFKLENNPAIEFFIQKGMERGREEGIQQGMERGMQQGIAEAQRKSIAVMLKYNLPVEGIAKELGVNTEIVEEVRSNMNSEHVGE